MVVRPSSPDGVSVALKAAAQSLVTGVPVEGPPADDYVFVGYLALDGSVVDADGHRLGKPEPGDSFVTYDEGMC